MLSKSTKRAARTCDDGMSCAMISSSNKQIRSPRVEALPTLLPGHSRGLGVTGLFQGAKTPGAGPAPAPLSAYPTPATLQKQAENELRLSRSSEPVHHH